VHAREAPPLWEAGVFVGAATQPAYPGAEDHTGRAALLPYLIYRGLAFAPELVHERRLGGGWNAGLRCGPVFGDERLADLFYQVDPVHATATRPAYDASGGLIAWRAGASLRRSLSRDLSVFGFVRLESVVGATNRNSPLVRRDTGVAGGIGLAWTFARSSQPAVD
jgi:hypothetical protein